MPRWFGSPAATQIVTTLAVYGPLTEAEIRQVTSITHGDDKLRQLEKLGLVTHWRGRYHDARRHLRPVRKIWAIDKRHPWYLSLENLGRRLQHAFPLRGSLDSGGPHRRYLGPLAPKRVALPFVLFGTRDQHRLIMLLAHTGEHGQEYALHTIARRLGIGYTSVSVAMDHLQELGIVITEWRSRHRFVQLNRRFPAWREIRRLAHLMDQEWGGEFAAIAKAHLWDRAVNKKRQRLRKKGPKATLWRAIRIGPQVRSNPSRSGVSSAVPLGENLRNK